MTHLEPAEAAAAQAARNDAAFRDANEHIESYADSIGALDGDPLPFLCECADVSCTEIVRMTPAEYADLREQPARFTTVPGHERHESWARVVEQNERFEIVEKVGVAADVAADLDTRGGGANERAQAPDR